MTGCRQQKPKIGLTKCPDLVDHYTQFRVNKCNEQIEGLSELIQRGVKWKTPVQIAKQDGLYYLTDGFHRVEAYASLGIEEIPEGQFEIVECATQDEVIMLAMRANAAHGNQNTVEDRVLMMNKLIQMDEKRYKPTPWEIAVKEVAEALQITIDQARTACKPKNDELKEQRDAAILEMRKGGNSNTTIGKALGMSTATIGRILERLGGLQNGDSPFSNTPESPFTTPMSVTVPMASTLDRAATREDADAYIASQLSSLEPLYMEEDELSLTIDEDDEPPFDVLAATGWGAEQATYNTKSSPVVSASSPSTYFDDETTDAELDAMMETILEGKEKAMKVLQEWIHRENALRQRARNEGRTLSK